MKKFLLLLTCLAAVCMARSQTVDSVYTDGVVNFKLYDTSQILIPDYPGEDPNPYFDTLYTKYGITKIDRWLKHSDKPGIQLLYTVSFDSIYKVDSLLSDIASFENVEFAEKSAIVHLYGQPSDSKYHLQWL